MTDKLGENIKVELGPYAKSKTFTSLDEVLQWIDQEQQFWQWLEEVGRKLGNLQPLWNNPRNAWGNARKSVNEYRASKDDAARRAALERIANQLSSPYEARQALPSSSPKAHFVQRLKEANPYVAGYTLLTFLNPTAVPPNDAQAVKGMFQAHLFEFASTEESAAAQRSALDQASREWAQFSGDARVQFAGFAGEMKQLSAAVKQLHSDQSEDFKKKIDEAESSLNDIAKTYDEKLALQAPVQYWAGRAKAHTRGSISFAAAWILLAVVSVGVIWLEINALLIGKQDPEYWQYAVIVATATLLIWPLRILARLLLSNLHLRTDARERVTMANTYLSLLRSGQGLTEGDRRLILETLFHPTSTGIVKDDAAPPSLAHLISRLSAGEKK